MRDDDTPNGMNDRHEGAFCGSLYSAREIPGYATTKRYDYEPQDVTPVSGQATKDDGQDHFASGYVRDSSEGKPAFDLLPFEAMEELGILFAEGAKKYGPLNYRKGAPIRRHCASLFRHAHKALAGIEDEGATERSRRVRHLIATAWNALVAAQTLIDIDKGELPQALDDRYKGARDV